ncbi:MAG: hypothetical protein ACI9H6_000434 [Patiriisocius sp.]|jgi:hypothetical protein
MNIFMKHIILWTATLAVLLGVGLYGIFTASERSGVTFREVLDEALIRIPIPPSPVSLRENVVPKNVDQIAAASSTYRRVLPGMAPASNPVESVSQCARITKGQYDCYADYLTDVVASQGIPEAFVVLKKLYNDGDSFAIAQCHQLVHVIGRAATTQFSTVAESYNYGDILCWSGYYHGIMEAIIAEMGIENVPKQLNDVCSVLPSRSTYGFNYFNCVHGLGHGVMYVAAHNLFEALDLCNLLEGDWEQSSCYGGVYMENVIANEVDHISEYFRDDDVLYPCTEVDDRYKASCYLMQTSHVLTENGYDFQDAFAVCTTADSGYENTCYQSIGRDASGSSNNIAEVTMSKCLMGHDHNAQEHCVTGAAKDFVSYYHSDTEAIVFCEALPEEHIDSCMLTVQEYYSVF